MTTAIAHDILARHRPHEFGPTLLSDFTLDGGTQVPAETLLNPAWSLYGLDLLADQALFVEMPPGFDLSSAAFLSIQQFAQSLRLIRLPLDDLPAVAALMPRPDDLILMFSIGRCGSTLASRFLAQVDGVLSLSEPEPFMALALARNQMPHSRQQTLIPALTRLMFRPRSPADRILALKFHSQVLFQTDHFHNAFPDATYVFQYRDALSWANSFCRFMQIMGSPRHLQGPDLEFAWQMLSASAPFADFTAQFDMTAPIFQEHVLAAGWALYLQTYLDLRRAGVPFFPLRYNELNSDPHAQATALLAHCNLTVPDLDAALTVFHSDSQEGTSIGRDAPVTGFSPADFARFQTLLAGVAPHLDPNLILPA